MSNISRELSRTSSSRSLRSHDSSAFALNNSAYDLERSSYKIINFTASSLASLATSSLVASSSASFYSHHIKFNISKLDEETQRNHLQNFKNLILMENSNKTQDIKPTQYSMDEIFNRFKGL